MLNLSPPRMNNVLYTVPIIIGMRIAYYYRNENSVDIHMQAYHKAILDNNKLKKEIK